MKVKDIMSTTPVALERGQTVWSAVKLMVERNVGSILVTENAHLIGIFTERDLLKKVIYPPRNPHMLRLEDVMTPSPEVTHEMESALVALRKMLLCGFRHLPVVGQNRPVGMISFNSPHLADLLIVAEQKLGFNFDHGSVKSIIKQDFEDELTQYAKEQYGTKVFREHKNRDTVHILKNHVRDEFKKIYHAMKRNEEKQAADAESAKPASAAQGAVKIFVLDDEETLLSIYEKNLQYRGFSVTCFSRTDDLLKRLQWEKPDMLVLDWVMPQKNGMEALREMRSIPGMDQIPVIMATGIKFPGDRKQASTACTVDEYMTKPIDFDEMDACIRRLVSTAC